MCLGKRWIQLLAAAAALTSSVPQVPKAIIRFFPVNCIEVLCKVSSSFRLLFSVASSLAPSLPLQLYGSFAPRSLYFLLFTPLPDTTLLP